VPDAGLNCKPPTANCSGNAADGCNIDLRSDNANCGGCGIVCNTQCTKGVCPLFTSDAGAPQQVGDFACLAVDSKHVYWGTGLASNKGGGVWTVSINGGTPSLLIGQQDRPHGMASDGTHLYYANYGAAPNTGTVEKIPVGGGTASPIASGQASPLDVVLDQNNVYWTNSGDGTVWKSDKNTPNPVKLANGTGQGHAMYLRVDATYAYFTDRQSGAVKRVPIDGSNTTPVTVTSAPGAGHIAIDTKSAYVGSNSNKSGAVLSVALNAKQGSSTQILPNLGNVQGVETDGTRLWYAVSSNGGNQNSGTINRATVGGKNATPLATGQNYPGCISVDSKSVYWINEGGGQISKTGR